MNELDRTVIVKRAATVIDTRPVLTIAAPYHRRADLVAEVKRQARRGEIRPLTARPAYNQRTGDWEQRVVRLREPAPAWIRPAAIISLVLAGAGILTTLLWWVLTSLATTPLALFLLAALGALVVIARSGRKPTVSVTQKVTIR